MNTFHEKIILDSSAFYTFVRHFKNQIDASYELCYFYFDTTDFDLIKKNQTLRIRSFQSQDYKAQWEFRYNTNIFNSKANETVSFISAYLQQNEAEKIINEPTNILTGQILPNSISDNVKDLSNKIMKIAGSFRINRKFMSFGEILVKADECVFDKNTFYEISINANDFASAKEKIKEKLSALNLSFSFSNLSKLSKIESFRPYIMSPKL